MVTLAQIEADLITAQKQRAQLELETLRGLKTRIQNEKIAKSRELEDSELVALLRSEVKRRKDAIAAYEQGGRAELAEKEQNEITIITKYLPPEVSEAVLRAAADALMAEQTYTQGEMGQVIGNLKKQFPDGDGALIAKIVKEKLSNA